MNTPTIQTSAGFPGMKGDKTNYWFFIVFLTIAGMLAGIPGLAQDKYDRVLSLHGKWKFNIGDKSLWADPYFNDKTWETIYVPAKWEEEGFNGYNGFAWYRTSFEGAELEDKQGSYSLFLGYIDDVDEVFLNGHKIGSSGSFPPRYHTAYSAFRAYFIPREFLNLTGKNVIAVRVYDAEIEGGIVSGEVGIYSSRNDAGMAVNMRGMWDFRIEWKSIRSAGLDEKSVNTLASTPDGWTEILVPATWESQGFEDYDGGAWYRKKFTIPKTMAGEDVVLVLGKIDDSDKAFLNGKLVGTMTDSWQSIRYYHITASQLKAGEVNTLMVFVDDPQGNGGIYEGPVGIMKQADFTKYLRWK
ncbi:MAG TPA: beta galactosidase jelly roll domain-containing protein [Cyclobacteriaceae bacterium]|nr:beta galactosidase jelly roll domain-containing protein [Cyclobacteriaceae bacterium]